MARSIVLSNGELCVALDSSAQVRDIYYPHVGLEDHVRGHYVHRIGVWVDGRMSWFSEDPAWTLKVSCAEDALQSAVVARNDALQVDLIFSDIVHSERPIFLRRITVRNGADREREIKLYFGHQFEIYKSHGGDTAYFDPVSHSIIHYKGRRVFLIGATLDGEPFHDFVAGRANFAGKEGSHKDAEDGSLSRNPIEHGPADSVIGLYGKYASGQSRTCHYWIAAAHSIPEAHELDQYIVKKTPEHLEDVTIRHWQGFVKAHVPSMFNDLAPEHIVLFKRSLMYVKAHVDNDGGILASVDSDTLQYGYDTYTYVWPRDGALCALSLLEAKEYTTAKHFLEFCSDVMAHEGYLMHKYLADKSLGSSWHPWMKDGLFQLPIQEDETALVIHLLARHFEATRDREFLESMYPSLVERAADFLVQYRDEATKLPKPSYDLWEEKRGVSTFTCASVYAALRAAAELSQVLGKSENQARYRTAAQQVRDAITAYLWDDKQGIFYKMINRRDDKEEHETIADMTLDISSAYGVFLFGVVPYNDPKLARAFEETSRRLSYGLSAGGLARYEGDKYYRSDSQSAGNPWIITTLWYAEYLIANARTDADFAKVRDIFSWVCKRAQQSGALPEQIHPQTGEPLSVSPLTWSHAAYIGAVLKYLAKRAAS